jgi:hypothetical protein
MIVECRLQFNLYKFGETIRPIKDAIVVPVNVSLQTIDLWHFQCGQSISKDLKTFKVYL